MCLCATRLGVASPFLPWGRLGHGSSEPGACGSCKADPLVPCCPLFPGRAVASGLPSHPRHSPSVGLKIEQLEEEFGDCLEKGEKAGGALQAPEVASPAAERFQPLLCRGN